MQLSILLITVLSASVSSRKQKYNSNRQDVNTDEFFEMYLTGPDIIDRHGYKCETHIVTTSDGYILESHRIPYGRDGPSKNRAPVLLSHGMTTSSIEWIITGPRKGLGYVLADAGFDVWMINYRGTIYSRNHTHLDPDEDSKQYWNFSWHELGVIDTADTIDYILKATDYKQLSFIGHSQGTTCLYVLLSEKPEYNMKLKMAISLGASAYYAHSKNTGAMLLASFRYDLQEMFNTMGFYEIPHTTSFVKKIMKNLCHKKSRFLPLCLNLFSQAYGFHPERDISLIPKVFGHIPAGSSTMQFLHYLQLVGKDEFCQFDFGKEQNMFQYGDTTPPNYKLENMAIPHYLFYSESDGLLDSEDVMKIYKRIKNTTVLKITRNPFYHADYAIGPDVSTFLYPSIINLLLKHS